VEHHSKTRHGKEGNIQYYIESRTETEATAPGSEGAAPLRRLNFLSADAAYVKREIEVVEIPYANLVRGANSEYAYTKGT
jgi:hypothetical protein